MPTIRRCFKCKRVLITSTYGIIEHYEQCKQVTKVKHAAEVAERTESLFTRLFPKIALDS